MGNRFDYGFADSLFDHRFGARRPNLLCRRFRGWRCLSGRLFGSRAFTSPASGEGDRQGLGNRCGSAIIGKPEDGGVQHDGHGQTDKLGRPDSTIHWQRDWLRS